MNKYFLVWILYFFSYSVLASEFQLTVAPTQDSFELGTPVHLSVSLTNTSSTEQQLPQQFDPQYGLLTYKIGGLKLAPWVQVQHMFAEKLFAPNETVTQEIPIYFGERGWVFHSQGYYTVEASYQGVSSNKTEVVITQPGSKGMRAADILLQSRQAGLLMLGKNTSNLSSGAERLKQVIELYPETTHAEYATQALAAYTEARTQYFAQSVFTLESDIAEPWFSYSLPQLVVSSDSFDDISSLTQGSDWLNELLGINDNLYRVSGYINDKNGLPISDVSIKVDGASAVVTDADGYYEIINLPEGEYELVATKSGYHFNPTIFIVSNNNPDAKVHVSAPSSNLSIEIELDPFIVFQGEPLITYSIQVTNEGEEAATKIELTNELPENVSFQAVDTEGGSCQKSGQTVNCSLPTLNPNKTWVVQVHVVPHGTDTLVNVAHVQSKQYPSDSDTLTVPIRPYFSALLWTNPNPVLVNQHVVYQMRIMNGKYSPTSATDVALSFDIPNGTEFLTAETRDGYCKLVDEQLVCDLNNIAKNSHVDIEITAKPSQSGSIAQTFSVTSTQFDEYRTTQNLTVLDPDAGGNADLVILIDDTGSMAEDIKGVQRALYRMINDLDSMEGLAMPRVAILTFKDDVTQRVISSDFSHLLSTVTRLNASGGGLCPEASVQAMAEGLNLLKDGGQLLLVTDASPHPDTYVAEVLEVMGAKSAKLNVMLSGRCQTENVADPLVRESKTRRIIRIEQDCDVTGQTIANTEAVYGCMVEKTGGLYAWNNDVKTGAERYVAELEDNVVEVLRQVIEDVNSDLVFTDETEQVIDAVASELYNPPLGYVVLSIAAPNGRVVDENLSIDCNQQACQYYLKYGTKVSLTPIAPQGMYLHDWGGIGCDLSSFHMLEPKGCLAIFYNNP